MDGSAMRRYLAFDLDGSAYAVEVERVEVVLEMIPVTHVPRAPEQLRGVINYRGTVIPVADLRVRFGTGLTDLAKASSIVVLQVKQGGDDITIGILADTVREVIDFEVDKLDRSAGFGTSRLDDMVKGVYAYDGSFIVVLDIDKAFEDFEEEV
ncbi:MAG TPA: chemotaxis protein CheW [Rectinemataceae bacterium]|nr:chemotaxis protein CheW [Rectinemataceae bacterium]